VKRALTPSERESIEDYSKRYVEYKNIYREEAAGE
jgi:hypothetical protein